MRRLNSVKSRRKFVVGNFAGKPFLDKAGIQHPKLVTDGADCSTATIPTGSKFRYRLFRVRCIPHGTISIRMPPASTSQLSPLKNRSPKCRVSNQYQITVRRDFQPLDCFGLALTVPANRSPSSPNGREPWHLCIPWPEQVIVQLVPGRTRAQSGALAHLGNYKHPVNQGDLDLREH